MSAITTHVLDTSRGRPAAHVPIVLSFKNENNQWIEVGSGETDADGRLRTLLTDVAPLSIGVYRITFDTETYFKNVGVEGFYPEASITFRVLSATEHYHVPLLLQPYGFATYRGS